MDLGSNIRTWRQRQGLTLEELAERTGVSRAMLSDIERGVKNPTIRVVVQIAEGFGCTVSQLLGEQAQKTETVIVTRHDERQILVDPHTGAQRHLLSPAFLQRGIEVIWYVIPPQQTGSFPPHQPGVVEHITVVQGRLNCQLGDWQGTLASGDSVFFQANVPHDLHNPGPEPCYFFLLIDSGRAGYVPL